MIYLHLKQGDVLLGVLEVVKVDSPWAYGSWISTDDFFWVCQEELKRLQGISASNNLEETEIVREQIAALQLRLVVVGTEFETTTFKLYIQDETACFRLYIRDKTVWVRGNERQNNKSLHPPAYSSVRPSVYRDQFQPDFTEFYLIDLASYPSLNNGRSDEEAMLMNRYPKWPAIAAQNNLWLAPGVIGVRSYPDLNARVIVEVAITDSPLAEPGEWRACSQCEFEAKSGKLALSYYGRAAYRPLVRVEPGCYKARVYYGNQDNLRDTEDFDAFPDEYKIVLWR